MCASRRGSADADEPPCASGQFGDAVASTDTSAHVTGAVRDHGRRQRHAGLVLRRRRVVRPRRRGHPRPAAGRRGRGDPRRRRRVHAPRRAAGPRGRGAAAHRAGRPAPGAQPARTSRSTRPSSRSPRPRWTPAPRYVNDVTAFRDGARPGRPGRRPRRPLLPDAHARRARARCRTDPRYADVVDDVKAFLHGARRVRRRARASRRTASTSTRASASARRWRTTSSCWRRTDEIVALGFRVRDRGLAQVVHPQARRRARPARPRARARSPPTSWPTSAGPACSAFTTSPQARQALQVASATLQRDGA